MRTNQALLVEGADDQHVIWGLLKHHNFPETFEIDQKGGIDNLLKVLPVQLKGSGIQAVGVIIDADVNVAARWQSLRQLLVGSGFTTCPPTPTEGGLILQEDGLPRFGAWIMPDNKVPGMLEDFVRLLIPANDDVWPLVESAVAGIPAERREFSEAHTCKAQIHTWLAWQADPGTPMGLAITKKYLDAESVVVPPFLDWLQRLFVPREA